MDVGQQARKPEAQPEPRTRGAPVRDLLATRQHHEQEAAEEQAGQRRRRLGRRRLRAHRRVWPDERDVLGQGVRLQAGDAVPRQVVQQRGHVRRALPEVGLAPGPGTVEDAAQRATQSLQGRGAHRHSGDELGPSRRLGMLP